MTEDFRNVAIVEKDGEFHVTSLQVAEHFEKEHRHVLRDIKDLDISEKFRESNFGLSNYVSLQGKKLPLYLLTRDGFTILAMGFTGPKATEWKVRYLEAFNSMEQELTRIGGTAWLRKRIDSRLYRKPLTDTIKKFIEYAVEQGSETYKTKPWVAYSQFTKMEYKALFLLSKDVVGLRDKLSILDLNALGQAETIVKSRIQRGMDNKVFYKEIYQDAKRSVEVYADLMGPVDARGVLEPVEGNPFSLPEGIETEST